MTTTIIVRKQLLKNQFSITLSEQTIQCSINNIYIIFKQMIYSINKYNSIQHITLNLYTLNVYEIQIILSSVIELINTRYTNYHFVNLSLYLYNCIIQELNIESQLQLQYSFNEILETIQLLKIKNNKIRLKEFNVINCSVEYNSLLTIFVNYFNLDRYSHIFIIIEQCELDSMINILKTIKNFVDMGIYKFITQEDSSLYNFNNRNNIYKIQLYTILIGNTTRNKNIFYVDEKKLTTIVTQLHNNIGSVLLNGISGLQYDIGQQIQCIINEKYTITALDNISVYIIISFKQLEKILGYDIVLRIIQFYRIDNYKFVKYIFNN